MRKLSILMAAVFCVGTAGLIWAEDLNPQPLPPGARSTGGDGGIIAPSDSHSAGEKAGIIVVAHPQNKLSKTQRKAGGTQQRKAGGENLTLNGKNQINGNKTNSPDVFTEKKGGKAGFDVFTKNGAKNSARIDPYKKNKSSLSGKNSISGNSALNGGSKAGLNFTHGNGLQKQGMGDGSLPAVQTNH